MINRFESAATEQLRETRSVSRNLIERALKMRALGYYSEVKASLLTQTIFEVNRSRKDLSRVNLALDRSQTLLQQQVEERTQSLQQSEARYRDLVENQLAMITTFLPDTTRTFVNKTYAEFWKKNRESLIGKRWIEVFPESKQSAILKKLAACTLEQPVIEYEHELKLPDGRVHWLHWQFIASFGGAGEIIHFQGVAVDITDRKTMEQELEMHQTHLQALVEERTRELTIANARLEELDRLKSLFIASMSHELRTPLNSIIGFSGIMLQGMEGELNRLQTDHMGRIQRAARHLLDLITEVIDISKIEAGQLATYQEKFSLEGVISEAVECLQEKLHHKDLILERQTSPLQLYTDRRRLLQCVMNYLSNAIKYTEVGKVVIKAIEQQGNLVLSVTDTGIGIRAQDQARLFTQFTRIDSPQVRRTPGTGLGLYLTKKIVEEVLQGQVSMTSEYGRGSTFVLHVPLYAVPTSTGDRG